ncbi:MAG TPA: hypothetical protein DCS11_09395, partial [Syntrophus sp. (in: bacteria)]|nr:hypothetical protein [Syntrophus sp. (in: bacteria)]
WEDFKAEGRILDERAPERFGAICRAVRPEDLATIAYTSGTTGPPKGAMITHANLYHTVLNATQMHHYEESDFGLAFLPLTHMLQRMTVYAAMHLGIVGAYAESIDRLVDNFRELKPTVQVSVPQIFERVYNRIQQMLAGGSPLKGRIFLAAAGLPDRPSPPPSAGRGPHRVGERRPGPPRAHPPVSDPAPGLHGGGRGTDPDPEDPPPGNLPAL